MSLYRWAMRYGAAILFVIACLQLVIGLLGAVQAFQIIGSAGEYTGVTERPSQALVVLQTLMAGVLAAALPFFGALVIHRLDRRGDPRQAEPFE